MTPTDGGLLAGKPPLEADCAVPSLRTADLPQSRDGRRVRIAGMVITRQRPGTAKGFVFLTLEDETGISTVIIRPDLFDRQRTVAVLQPPGSSRRRSSTAGWPRSACATIAAWTSPANWTPFARF